MPASAALAAIAVALGFAVPAAAQAPPPDERATARAYADAAKRFGAATAELGEPGTGWLDPCRRALDRIPERHQDEALTIVLDHSFRLAFAELREPLRRFRGELALVPTADRVLISGRAAVRRMGRRLDAVPAPGRFCAGLRAWRRAGYPRSAARKAEATMKELMSAFSPGILRKLEATALRLRELGVPRRDAEAFGGEDW